MYKVKRKYQPIPRLLILGSIPLTAILGGLLLMLPICNPHGLGFIDSLFTAASAICVNGLLTVPLTSFTELGQWIILILMQIGGLGIITVTLMTIAAFVRTGLSTQVVASQILEIEHLRDIKQLLLTIITITLIAETIGTLILFQDFKLLFPTHQAIFYAIFHSVSAFCNAGLTIFSDSLVDCQHDFTILASMGSLILIGSIGFITWSEIFHWYQGQQSKLSLHSKLTLWATLSLISIFTITFFLLESRHSLAHLSWWEATYNAIFNAVSMRGAGFTTIDLCQLQPATLMLLIISSFIGAAPGSTGGGIKTSALIIFLATARAAFTNHSSVDIRKRSIPHLQVLRAFSIITLSVGWISLTTFALLITDPEHNFLSLLFEANSAFSMFGISLGITASLSILGKLLILLSMIIGRIGSLTLVLAFLRLSHTQEVRYPEGRLLLS